MNRFASSCAPSLCRSVAIVLLAAVGACTPRERAPEPPTTEAPRMSDSPNASPLVSSLQVESDADSLHFLLQVTNASAAPVQLTFRSGQSFDFVVLQDGRELWRWSADRMFTQAIRNVTLAPGETRTYDASWSPPSGTSGDLIVQGVLTAQEHRVEQQTEIRLP